MLLDLISKIAGPNNGPRGAHRNPTERHPADIDARIDQLEGQILYMRGNMLKDAATKLQGLKNELDEKMTYTQRNAFEHALCILIAVAARDEHHPHAR